MTARLSDLDWSQITSLINQKLDEQRREIRDAAAEVALSIHQVWEGAAPDSPESIALSAVSDAFEAFNQELER